MMLYGGSPPPQWGTSGPGHVQAQQPVVMMMAPPMMPVSSPHHQAVHGVPPSMPMSPSAAPPLFPMQHVGNMGSPMAMHHVGSGNTRSPMAMNNSSPMAMQPMGSGNCGSPLAMNNSSEMRPLEQSSSHRQAAMAASLRLRHQLHRGKSPSPKKTPPPPALLPQEEEKNRMIASMFTDVPSEAFSASPQSNDIPAGKLLPKSAPPLPKSDSPLPTSSPPPAFSSPNEVAEDNKGKASTIVVADDFDDEGQGRVVYKEMIVEVEKLVEKLVEVEKVVERIVYRDRPPEISKDTAYSVQRESIAPTLAVPEPTPPPAAASPPIATRRQAAVLSAEQRGLSFADGPSYEMQPSSRSRHMDGEGAKASVSSSKKDRSVETVIMSAPVLEREREPERMRSLGAGGEQREAERIEAKSRRGSLPERRRSSSRSPPMVEGAENDVMSSIASVVQQAYDFSIVGMANAVSDPKLFSDGGGERSQMPESREEQVGLGMALERDKEGVVYVQEVLRGFAAWHNGNIQEDDTLVSISGVAVRGMSPEELRRMTIGQVGTSVRVFMNRKGQHFETLLVRRLPNTVDHSMAPAMQQIARLSNSSTLRASNSHVSSASYNSSSYPAGDATKQPPVWSFASPSSPSSTNLRNSARGNYSDRSFKTNENGLVMYPGTPKGNDGMARGRLSEGGEIRGAQRTEQPETPPPTYSSLRASSRRPSYPDSVEEAVMMMPHIDKMPGGGDRPVPRSIDMGHVDSSKLAAIHRPDYAAQRSEEGPTTKLV